MGFDFSFRQIGDTSDVRRVVDFIATQDLGYPSYDAWVQRTEAELFVGDKEAIMAFSDGILAGDLVYQGHKELPAFLEMKNLRVHPRLRIRAFGRFMVRQAEVEARKKGYEAALVDTRPEVEGMVAFLASCGYTPVAEGPLYDPHEPDVTFVKSLKRSQESRILVVGRDYVERSIL